MKFNLADLGYPAFWFAIAVGFYSCNKYGTMTSDATKVEIEAEKTKQLELQLKLKQTP